MTRRLMIFAIFALLLAGTRPALAHGDFRIIGTITGVTETTLDVKQNKDDKVILMAINKSVARDPGWKGGHRLRFEDGLERRRPGSW